MWESEDPRDMRGEGDGYFPLHPTWHGPSVGGLEPGGYHSNICLDIYRSLYRSQRAGVIFIEEGYVYVSQPKTPTLSRISSEKRV